MADDDIDLEALFSQGGSEAGNEEENKAHDLSSDGNEGTSSHTILIQA